MLYDITIKENEDNSDTDVSTSTDAYIDYDKLGDVIYSNTYNALIDYEKENTKNTENTKNYIYSSKVSQDISLDAPLVFASSTDANLYTVQTVDAPETLAEQVGAYTLDIRNILLLFLLIYLIITLYSKLKNTLIKFYGG